MKKHKTPPTGVFHQRNINKHNLNKYRQGIPVTITPVTRKLKAVWTMEPVEITEFLYGKREV